MVVVRNVTRVRAHGISRAAVIASAAAATALSVTAAAPGSPTVRPSRSRAVITLVPQARLADPRPAALPVGGYTPAQIRAAYFLNPLLHAHIDGKNQSIVIVDSFGSPTIRHDLQVFDRTFKIMAPRSLMIIHPAGRIPKFRNNPTRDGWAQETTLDVEWAHAMAPAARIVLVETPVSENEGRSGFPQIVKAEKYVIAHHLGGVISQSFGATEPTFPKGTLRPLRGAYIEAAQRAHRITVVSASGDAGATDLRSNMVDYYTRPVTSWPASDPLVTSVGGLDLALDSRGRRTAPDHVWNDPGGQPEAGGGGTSVMFSRPAYQRGHVASVVGRHRGVPDVSLSASCSHPVLTYMSFNGPGWYPICGTSEATPLFAGIIALADQVARHPLGPINSYLYAMAAAKDRGIVDVTHGDNTVTFQQGRPPKIYTVHGWSAVRGYDLSSGIGTIKARFFVPELVALARKHGS